MRFKLGESQHELALQSLKVKLAFRYGTGMVVVLQKMVVLAFVVGSRHH